MRTSVLLVAALVLRAQAPAPAEPKPGKVEMIVLNSVTGAPVPGITVALSSISGGYITRVDSDEFGQLRFNRVEPGSYRVIEVIAKGYSYDKSVEPAIFLVKEDATVQGGKISMIPHGSISGRVLNENGDPIPGATVTAFQFWYLMGRRVLQPGGEAKTDPEGRYKILDLSPQPFTIRVNIERALFQYNSVYYPSAETASQALRVAVTAGSEVPAVDFRLRPVQTFHFRGTISGISSEPSQSLMVFSCPEDPWERESLIGYTEIQKEAGKTEGTFDMGNLQSGRYCFRYQSRSTSSPKVALETVRIDRSDVDDYRITAVPPATIRGVVKIEGQGTLKLPTQLFEIQTSVMDMPSYKPDPEKGTFQITNIWPGASYKLSPRPTGASIRSSKVNGEEIRGSEIRFRGDAEMEIVMAPARGSVKGRVNFGSSKAQRTRLTVTPVGELSQRSDLIRNTYTTDQGEFEMTGLAPGEYKVLAWEKADDNLTEMADFLVLFTGTAVKVPDGAAPAIEVRPIPARAFDEAKARF